MPGGELVTVPVPVPDFETVRVLKGRNWAATVVPESIGTVQVPVPEHPLPDQPENWEFASGVADSVTWVPAW